MNKMQCKVSMDECDVLMLAVLHYYYLVSYLCKTPTHQRSYLKVNVR